MFWCVFGGVFWCVVVFVVFLFGVVCCLGVLVLVSCGWFCVCVLFACFVCTSTTVVGIGVCLCLCWVVRACRQGRGRRRHRRVCACVLAGARVGDAVRAGVMCVCVCVRRARFTKPNHPIACHAAQTAVWHAMAVGFRPSLVCWRPIPWETPSASPAVAPVTLQSKGCWVTGAAAGAAECVVPRGLA